MTTVVRVDPHVHTQASFDSEAATETVLEHAAASELDALVVTDHDCIINAIEAAERAPAYGLVGIPGAEVSTTDGHLLAVGISSLPPGDRPFEETVAAIRDQGGLAIVPHPFQRSRHGVARASVHDCDGVEVFNAMTVTGVRNSQAARFAVERGYPGFGASDAHRPSDVGRAYTEVAVDAADPDADDILAAMGAGRCSAVGRRVSTGRYVSKWASDAKRRSASLLRSP